MQQLPAFGWVVVTMTAGAGLTAATVEAAPLTLRLTSDASIITVVDNGVGDTDTAIGQVAFSGTVGGIETAITVGVSNSPGTSDLASLNLTSLAINNVGGATSLMVELSDAGFLAPNPAGGVIDLLAAASASTTVGSVDVDFTGYANDSNGIFATEQASSPAGFSVSTPAGTGSSAITPVTLGAPYSLTSVLELDIDAGTIATVTGNTSIIPEPATLALIAAGIAVGVIRRRA
ncbi:MAG: PEP-CTERM sorting domain-containing protein [Planctomycetota bacterium]